MSNSSDDGEMAIDNLITASTPTVRRALRRLQRAAPPPRGRLQSPFARGGEAAAAAAAASLEDDNGKKLK